MTELALDRTYFGRLIRECERADHTRLGRWIIQDYHVRTGLPLADEDCVHYRTLAEAKDTIRLLNAITGKRGIS